MSPSRSSVRFAVRARNAAWHGLQKVPLNRFREVHTAAHAVAAANRLKFLKLPLKKSRSEPPSGIGRMLPRYAMSGVRASLTLVPIQSDIENPQIRRLGNPLAIPVNVKML